MIIQDADNLDSIGAIGIARCFAFGGFHNSPLWDGKFVENSFYEPSKINNSSLQHFNDKLLKIKENLNTNTAREIAEKRHQFLKAFVDQFIKEWEGEL
ncbi:hypothetical protein GOV13_02310 [Candidatus Pacearchaeota archaeon]|nr:hypothetical protein [Candidatus Pacearchaeota archaeon]